MLKTFIWQQHGEWSIYLLLLLLYKLGVIKKNILFILDRGEGREKERETSMCGCLLSLPFPWGPDLACNPGMCPDWESNSWPFGSQAGTQSTEPQPGQLEVILMCDVLCLSGKIMVVMCLWMLSQRFLLDCSILREYFIYSENSSCRQGRPFILSD